MERLWFSGHPTSAETLKSQNPRPIKWLTPVHCPLKYEHSWHTRGFAGKVAMFTSLAVADDRRDRASGVQHIADILPLVLAKYATTHETQPIPRVEYSPSHIMPSPCVSV